MTKLSLEKKLENKATGFINPFIGYGGWGLMSLVSTVVSIFTGFLSNFLNIGESASHNSVSFAEVEADRNKAISLPKKQTYLLPVLKASKFNLFASSI